MSDRPSAPFRITPPVFHVLLTLSEGEAHAYGLMKGIEARTEGRVVIGPGSLHLILTKLRDAGMISVVPSPPGHPVDTRRKYYALTEWGREVLRGEVAALVEIVDRARDLDLVGERGQG